MDRRDFVFTTAGVILGSFVTFVWTRRREREFIERKLIESCDEQAFQSHGVNNLSSVNQVKDEDEVDQVISKSVEEERITLEEALESGEPVFPDSQVSLDQEHYSNTSMSASISSLLDHKLKTSHDWYMEDSGVIIKDPDGWGDVEDPEKFWKTELITKEDYILRRNVSTVSFKEGLTNDKEDLCFNK